MIISPPSRPSSGLRLRYDFDWVKLPLFDETGEPIHCRGVTACPGVYFLGLKCSTN